MNRDLDEILSDKLKEHEEEILQRKQFNLELLKIVEEYINSNEQLRFIQILWNLNIIDKIDRFHEEPQLTLKRVKNRLSQIEKMKNTLDVKEQTDDSKINRAVKKGSTFD